MSLSDRLRDLRRSRAWTQRGLARELARVGCDVTQAAISLWETDRSRPGARAIAALVALYELGPEGELDLYRLLAEAARRGPEAA